MAFIDRARLGRCSPSVSGRFAAALSSQTKAYSRVAACKMQWNCCLQVGALLLLHVLTNRTPLVLAGVDYEPSPFYFQGRTTTTDDSVYDARFRFASCSLCYRDQFLTAPNFLLPINTAGLLTEPATCSEVDARAASGEFSPAVCILLRNRVLDVCGCSDEPFSGACF